MRSSGWTRTAANPGGTSPGRQPAAPAGRVRSLGPPEHDPPVWTVRTENGGGGVGIEAVWTRGVWIRGAQITDDRKGNHVENALISCLLWKEKEKCAKRVDPLCSNTTHLAPHSHLSPLPPQLTWCGSVSGVRCFHVWMVRTVSCCSTIQAGAAGSQEAESGPPG